MICSGAVINAANGALVYGLGTAKALREAGGSALETERQQLMAAYAAHNISNLPAGAATVTGAGNMTNYKSKNSRIVQIRIKQCCRNNPSSWPGCPGQDTISRGKIPTVQGVRTRFQSCFALRITTIGQLLL